VTDKVVDASALAAISFQEDEEQELRARLRGHELHAPALLRYELASVCLKKIRLHPDKRDFLLTQLGASMAIAINEHPIDPVEVVALAETFKLSAYDASYLWLAQYLDAELVTLDEKLGKAAQRI
jgi:predicted nucleic acid-binding protein